MSDMTAIPNEILHQIFSLRVDVSPYLTSLSLVSRQFHALVQPILYSEVVIARKSIPGIPHFLRTILARPVLAGYVTLLDVSWIYISLKNPATPLLPQERADIRLFTPAARRVGLFRPVNLQAEQVALLLYLLPNLLVLKVDPPGEFYRWQEPDVLEQIFADYVSTPTQELPAGLRSVRAITFGPDGSEVSPTALFTMIKLPCIREIDIHNLVHTQDNQILSLFSPARDATSSVTSLRFGYGTIHHLLLARILAMPQALTRFSYNDCDGRPDSFNCTVLWTGLQRCRDTLQQLELWFRSASTVANVGSRGEREHGIPSLREWPALRRVRCQMATLLGRGPENAVLRLGDVVPAVMTDLTIDEDEYWKYPDVVGQVVEMVERMGCARLVKVAVGGSVHGIEQDVQARLGAAGVGFSGFKWRE